MNYRLVNAGIQIVIVEPRTTKYILDINIVDSYAYKTNLNSGKRNPSPKVADLGEKPKYKNSCSTREMLWIKRIGQAEGRICDVTKTVWHTNEEAAGVKLT